MVDKLTALRQALGVLRSSTQAGTNRPAGRATAAAQPGVKARPEGQKTLRQRVADQMSRIRPDDPWRRKKALRIIVETALTDSFGEPMTCDPAFHALVDQVTQLIESDPSAERLIQDALSALD